MLTHIRTWWKRVHHNLAISRFPISQKIGGLIALAMFVGACILYATGHHV